jgi:hypothetical protein
VVPAALNATIRRTTSYAIAMAFLSRRFELPPFEKKRARESHG